MKRKIKGITIHSRKKRITFIYDKACQMIDDLHKGENICGYKCNQCIVQQMSKSDETNGCCRTCSYQSDKGCTTRNLPCKLFNCEEVKKKYKVYEAKDIHLLDGLSRRQKLMLKFDLFSSREEILLDLYLGSILLAGIRCYFGLFKRMFYLFFKDKKKNNVGKGVAWLSLVILIVTGLVSPYSLVVIVTIGLIDEILVRTSLFKKSYYK